MSAMKEHLEDVQAHLHEVLGDVSGDPERIERIVAVTDNLPAVDRLVQAMGKAMLEEAGKGPVDFMDTLRSAFVFGLAAGITYERRGYTL